MFTGFNLPKGLLEAASTIDTENKKQDALFRGLMEEYGITHTDELAEEKIPEFLSKGESLLGEKYLGFNSLKSKLAAKGTRNPAAVAAEIGRNKYGTSKFNKAAATGHKLRTEEVLDESVTRKHFQQVADVIKAHPDQDKRNELAKHHADIFKKQNPRFDHGRFYKAAGATLTEESINEVSKKTLGSYIGKAQDSVVDHAWTRNNKVADLINYPLLGKEIQKDIDHHERKMNKRVDGVALAAKKLRKEEPISEGTQEGHSYGEQNKLVVSAINTFGTGQHPEATKNNLHLFGKGYVKGVLKRALPKAHPDYQKHIGNLIDSLKEASNEKPGIPHLDESPLETEKEVKQNFQEEPKDPPFDADKKHVNWKASDHSRAKWLAKAALQKYKNKKETGVDADREAAIKDRPEKAKEYGKVNEASNEEPGIPHLEEAVEFKNGDRVRVSMGPHKANVHEIIHDHGDGTYNIRPMTRGKIKYRLGAVRAKAGDMTKVALQPWPDTVKKK